MLKSMLILFFVNTHCKNKNIIRLNFELGDNIIKFKPRPKTVH